MPSDQQPATPKRSRLSLEQRIATREAQLARLKQQQHQHSRKLATREKIIVGAAVTTAARSNPELRRMLAGVLAEQVTKEIDREVIAPWLSPT